MRAALVTYALTPITGRSLAVRLWIRYLHIFNVIARVTHVGRSVQFDVSVSTAYIAKTIEAQLVKLIPVPNILVSPITDVISQDLQP
jgi:hypothetical protein